MANEKFSEFSAATVAGGAMQGVGLQGGANVRFPTDGLIQEITSDPSAPGPDVNLNADVVYVTTSGSAGNEYINIPSPSAGAVSPWYGNPKQAPKFIFVGLKTRTDPADVVRIYRAGNASFKSILTDESNTSQVFSVTDGVPLASPGDATVFEIIYDYVRWNPALADTEIAYGSGGFGGGTYTLGWQTASTGENGGDWLIVGGQGGAGANGGRVAIQGGTAGAGGVAGGIYLATNGDLQITDLPTSDPHVLFAIWNSAGTLKISAGP